MCQKNVCLYNIDDKKGGIGNGEIYSRYHREIIDIYEIIDQFGILLVTILNINNSLSLQNIKIFIATDTFGAIEILSNLLVSNFNQ